MLEIDSSPMRPPTLSGEEGDSQFAIARVQTRIQSRFRE
jgi:hypothetical protein